MPRQTLRHHLEQLRHELNAREQLDDRTRELLATLADEVEEMADNHEDRPHSPRERIESAALEFEAEHPTLARILREVGDTLAKLGV